MGGHNNSCTRAQVILTGTPLPHGKWAPRARSSAPSPTRPRHADAVKLEVFEAYLGQSFVRWVVMDMKWFREAAAGQYEQDLEAPPVADDVRYKPKMETQTQALKIMFMACVSEKKKIGLWEMKKEDWVKHTTKSGKPAKGIGWKFLFPFLKLIKKEAVRILGPGPPIGIWLDRAPCHIAKETQAELLRLFGDNVVLQPPSSPDLNMLDSGVFPNMQRKVNLKGANSIVDIRKAVNAVWDADITTEHLSKVAGRVRRNLVMIKKLKGGNWYIEK
jgi:hypothetical protein